MARLRRWEVRPRKSLGQCFLIDRRITRRIAAALGPAPGEPVIEIGPGTGELTRELAALGGRVWAVELDRGLAARLEKELDVEVILGDALNVRFRALVPHGSFAVTGNLPYYCTTDLILHVLAQREGLSRAVFLVQREYADRLVSAPGRKAYGSIGVFVRYFCEIERLFPVPAGAFYPRPEVQSSVIRLTMRPDRGLSPERERTLFRIVRQSFGQRRKQLGTALRPLLAPGAGREALRAGFARAGVDPTRRGETLSLEEFMSLAEALEGQLS